MVTYQQLRDVDLSSLDTLAGSFEQLVRKWDLSSAMASQIITPLEGSGWSGDAANAAGVVLTNTRAQIDFAFGEASALAKVLRDAHDQFAAAQKALKSAIDDAGKQGLSVADDGDVTWPRASAEQAQQNPNYDTDFDTKAKAIAARISAALGQASDADTAAAAALAGDTGTGTTGFNTSPLGGIPEEEAKQAAQLLSLGAGATDAQVAQLDQLLKENSGDPRFGAVFYQTLGPQNFVTDWALLAQSGDYANSKGRSDALKDIQTNLGLSLASATGTGPAPHLSDEWEAELRKVGASHVQVFPGEPADSQPYGYQVLSNILRNGNYSAHFLDPIADDVTQLTAANTAMWDTVTQHHAYPFTEIKFLTTDGTGFNPLSGVLEALGHSPAASTGFFANPDGSPRGIPGGPSYLKLLTSAGSDGVASADSMLMDRNISGAQGPLSGLPQQAEVVALGHALEAGTMGLPWDDTTSALPPHTGATAGVMSQMVDAFGHGDGPGLLFDKNGAPGQFNALVPSLGKVTGAYISDVQNAIAHDDKTVMDPGGAGRLLAALGHSPDAYASVVQANQAALTAQIQQVLPLDASVRSAKVEGIALTAGQVNGIMNAGRVDEVYKLQQVSDNAYNAKIDQRASWGTKVWDFSGGKVLGKIPVAGDPLNGQVHQAIQNYADSFKVDHSGNSADQAMSETLNAGSDNAAKEAVSRAIAGSGMDDANFPSLQDSSSNGYKSGFALGLSDYNTAVNGANTTGIKG